MPDDSDEPAACVSVGLWAMSSSPPELLHSGVQSDKERACVKGREGVDREAADTVEGIPS